MRRPEQVDMLGQQTDLFLQLAIHRLLRSPSA